MVCTLLFLWRLYGSEHQNKGDFFIMDFLKILKALTAAMDLELSDICVMAVLCTYAQFEDDKTVELSVNDIHTEFERLHKRTIQRSLARLSELHYIQTIKQKAPKKNKYKVLIDIPKGQAQPPIHQKKNPYKQSSEQTPIEEYERIIRKNPFMQ